MIKKVLVILTLIIMISAMFILYVNNTNNKVVNYNSDTTSDYSFTITTSVNPVNSGANFYINASGLKYLTGSGDIYLYVNGAEVYSSTYSATTYSIKWSLTADSSIYEKATITTGRPPDITTYDGTSNTINEVVNIVNYNVEFIPNINTYYGLNISNILHIQKGDLNLSFSDGTYSYKANSSGYNDLTGSFTVNGANLIVYLNFTLIEYNVEFIPNINAYYGLNISNILHIQKGDLNLSFSDGTYSYKANSSGYNDLTGSFTVNGANLIVYLNFTSNSSVQIKYIIFRESGFSGEWSILVNGNIYSSHNNSIYIVMPNYVFNYSYSIIKENNYQANKTNGYVNNTLNIVYVQFNKVSPISYNIFIFVILIITGLIVYLVVKRL
jgi:lipopolysaccharide export system protein LptC